MPAEPTVHAAIEAQAAARPDAVALVDGRRRLTFAQLDAAAAALAAGHIQPRRPGGAAGGEQPPVGVSCEPCAGAVVAVLGILKAGRPYLPLDPLYPAARLKYYAENAGVRLVLATGAGFVGAGWYTGEVVLIDGSGGGLSPAPSVLQAAAGTAATGGEAGTSGGGSSHGSSLAYVVYTSGSTGRPKGVMGPHGAMVNRLEWMWAAFPFKAGEVGCQKTSWNFLDSVWETLGTLGGGAQLVVASAAERKDVSQLAGLLASHAVSRLVLVPQLLGLLLSAIPAAGLPELRYLTVSGDALPWPLADRAANVLPAVTLLNLYGQTETAADVTCMALLPGRVASGGGAGGVPIGAPIRNVEIAVVDPETLGNVAAGTVGEVLVLGAALGRGYWGAGCGGGCAVEPAAAARSEMEFVRLVRTAGGFELASAGPGNCGAERGFRTGDFGFIDECGMLNYVGRRDQRVKVRGVRIDMLELEAALGRAAAAAGIALGGCAAAVAGEPLKLVVFAELAGGAEEAAALLAAGRADELPAAMVPSRLVAVAALPVLPSGKVDRQACKRLASAELGRLPAGLASGPAAAAATGTLGLVQRLAADAFLSEAGAKEAARLVPTAVPLASLGADSMEAMAFKQALHSALAAAHPSQASAIAGCPELVLEFETFEELTLETLAGTIEAVLQRLGRGSKKSGGGGSGQRAGQIGERDKRLPKISAQLKVSGIQRCADGDVAGVRALLAAGEWDPVHAVDKNQATALMWAAGNGHLEVSELLLEQDGVEVDAVNKQGRTALMQAAKHGQLAVVRLLIEKGKAELSQLMRDGSAVLDWAVLGGHLPTVEYLLGLGPEVVDPAAVNSFGCNAVHWACSVGNVKTCKWLLLYKDRGHGFDFEVINHANHGAVDAAAWHGHRACVEWLLVADDGPRLTAQLALIDKEGRSVVELAREAGHHELAQWMAELRG